MCSPKSSSKAAESPKQKRQSQYGAKSMVKGIAMSLLKNFVILVHIVVDYVLEWIGAWWWPDRKACVPLRDNFFVMKSGVEIAEMIRQRKVTVKEVVRAYIDRLNEVNPLLNAVVDGPFAKDALAQAKLIDDRIIHNEIDESEWQKKPFLGVPFTTKDSTAVKGKLQTLGLIKRRLTKAPEDAECVRLMKEAGAIIIATSNIPEVNRWMESRNNLVGQTNNPYDARRTAGGSSGGEAALLASCGSCIGLGTDIGGSIRIPAFYCGVFGHKPSTCGINTRGCTFRNGDETETMVVAGPMSRSAKDLLPMYKVLVDPRYADRLKLDTKVNVRKLRYFFATDLGDMRTAAVTPEMKAVVAKVTTHLEQISGRMCKRARLEGMSQTAKLWRYWMTQEPANFNRLLGNGTQLNGLVELAKKLLGQSDYTMGSLYSLLEEYIPLKGVDKLRALTEQLTQDLNNLLGEDGVLIFPSASSSAGFHYTPLVQIYKFSYFSIFNVLRVPVTQVPVGLDSRGLPLGVQVVAPLFRDRDCIAVAEELERTFGGWTPPFQVERE